MAWCHNTKHKEMQKMMVVAQKKLWHMMYTKKYKSYSHHLEYKVENYNVEHISGSTSLASSNVMLKLCWLIGQVVFKFERHKLHKRCAYQNEKQKYFKLGFFLFNDIPCKPTHVHNILLLVKRIRNKDSQGCCTNFNLIILCACMHEVNNLLVGFYLKLCEPYILW